MNSINTLSIGRLNIFTILATLVGALLIGLALYGALQFPLAPYWMVGGILVYVAIIYFFPIGWFVFLPAMLAAVHLAPWSGWLLFDEYDFFVLATAGILTIKGCYPSLSTVKKQKKFLFVLGVLTILYGIAFVKGFFPWRSFDANALSTYYTNYLSVRLVKSMVWVVILAPTVVFFFSTSREKVVNFFLMGMSIGLSCVGLTVLWERGVFADMLNFTDRYQLFRSLLDFSLEHRVTGMFADMHTGGESIDGYLVLAVPFALVALLRKQSPLGYTLAALALLLGLYSVLSTFTRATYLAVLASIVLVVFAFGFVKIKTSSEKAKSSRSLWWLPVFLIGMVAVFIMAYRYGGNLAVAGCALGIVSSLFITGHINRLSNAQYLIAITMLLTVVIYIVARSLWSSKWVENSTFESWTIGAILSLVSVGAGIGLYASTRSLASLRRIYMGSIILIAGAAIVVPAVFGNRMETRFATSSEDMKTRVDHWKNVAGLINDDIGSRVFGMGLGTYPKRYLFNIEKAGTVGSFAFVERGYETHMQIGGGTDLGIGQRVSVRPNENYTVEVSMDVLEGKPWIQVFFCYKNLLYQTHDNPCVGATIKKVDGQDNLYQAVLKSDFIGARSWLERWPIVFLVYSKSVGSLVEVKNISVRDVYGNEILSNREFIHGGDRWYSYNDFEHLQWHIKNFWLNVVFEMGLLGAFIFFVVLVVAVLNNWRNAKQGDVLSYALLAALVGIQLQGLFGSMMDAPRIAFLLLFLVTASFLKLERN